ncbi:NYN domain-containing protein [Oscillatoria sp. FACHB-1406]|uniref:NYN domain-containing protein n=1 Tax=Oscillatoria sp. FACHB-1406 TaxID=2692846 RepID=UPI0016871989|nr:NYN domain-containing protein [Oscillatoria sp. FACHB-1406]MBD2577460.1 NYN domain-containing protein [Oscillatoria sp. FACHB-1406]
MIDTPPKFDLIFQDVLRVIQLVCQNQPELLQEKYRSVDWFSDRAQSALKAKLKAILKPVNSPEQAIAQLQHFLQSLFLEPFFVSQIAKQLLIALHSRFTLFQSEGADIAILLLDAENLQLDAKTEKFLTSICRCPLRVKIAFANWRSLGKLDRDLHSRGYDLLHVPGGRDHADGKMIAVGSSLHERYPNAREVLVCSSDTIMTNLCNHLQQKGLWIYQIQKQGDSLEIFNSQTNQTQTFLLASIANFPSIEEFVRQIEEITQLEQNTKGSSWVKLSDISQHFRDRYKLTISQVVSYYWSDNKAKDFFIERPERFVVHKTSESSELYVTFFQSQSTSSFDPSAPILTEEEKSSSENSPISSAWQLEQILLQAIKNLTSKPGEFTSVEKLAGEFSKQYGEGVTKVLKRLQLDNTFTKFLQSSQHFKLQKDGKSYRVAATAP